MTRRNVYQLACGDTESHYVNPRGQVDIVTTLWREHGVYHVRTHWYGRGRVKWDSTNTLSAARALFRVHKSIADFLGEGI